MRTHSFTIIVALFAILVFGFVDAAAMVTNGTYLLGGCQDGCSVGTMTGSDPGLGISTYVMTNDTATVEGYMVGTISGVESEVATPSLISEELASPAPYFPTGPDHGLHIAKYYTPSGLLYSYLAGVDVTNGGGAGNVFYTISGDYFTQKSIIFWMNPGETVTIWAELCDSEGCTVPVQHLYVNVRGYHPEWGDKNVGSLIITPSPNYGFSAAPTYGPAPLTVSFATAIEAFSYNWDFGDGGTSLLKSPTHTYQNPGSYSVTLFVMNPGDSHSYTRSNYITVSPPTSGVTITVPNGGENWLRGTSHTITWSYRDNPGSSVYIELLKGTAVDSVISASAPIGSNGSGSYRWIIPYDQDPGTDYTIRISSTNNAGYTDTSNYFTISAGAPITVTVPNGGQNWIRGSIHAIKWSYTGNPGSNVKIALLKNGVVTRRITANTPIGSDGIGSYRWRVPFNLTPGTDYRIRLTSTSNSAYRDVSNTVFTISAGDPITVTVPNGGETWQRGSPQTIRWKYTGNPGSMVKIVLLKDGVVNRRISLNTPIGTGGAGSYAWQVPFTQEPGTDYKIWIISNTGYKDRSNAVFTINNTTILDPDLLGTWTLREMVSPAGTPLFTLFPQPITLTFSEEETVSGNGGCNTYGGDYSLTGASGPFGKEIDLFRIVSTLRYCENTSDIEGQYFQILSNVSAYRIDNNTVLHLQDPPGSSLTYHRT